MFDLLGVSQQLTTLNGKLVDPSIMSNVHFCDSFLLVNYLVTPHVIYIFSTCVLDMSKATKTSEFRTESELNNKNISNLIAVIIYTYRNHKSPLNNITYLYIRLEQKIQQFELNRK